MRRTFLLIFLIFAATPMVRAETTTAYFAGGCFWCVEALYQEQSGVTEVVSGFTGGTMKNPTYQGNHQGHFEAVEVTYDPSIIDYQTLLDLFWTNIDPFDDAGQFSDKGFSYHSAIFVGNDNEHALAQASKEKVEKRFKDKKIATEIRSTATFWPVEDFHQDYYLKNPVRYNYYRWGCGRDKRLEAIWGPAEQPH